jgi:hypothetical protein
VQLSIGLAVAAALLTNLASLLKHRGCASALLIPARREAPRRALPAIMPARA